MKSLKLALLIIALLGIAHAQYTLIEDATANPVACKDEPAPGKVTCGSCSKAGLKSFGDVPNQLVKIEFYCKACSNGKTPDSTPVTVILNATAASAGTAVYDINASSKCNSFLRSLPLLMVLMAFLIQTY